MWLNKTFGVHPWVAWQIDPFGNSAVSPALFAKMGFEAVILSWIGTTNYFELEKDKSTEFIWSGVSDGTDQSSLLAHALTKSRYSPPFEFKMQAGGYPSWLGVSTSCLLQNLTNNFQACMELFDREVIQPSLRGTQHNKIFSIWGDDFAFGDAKFSFDYIR